MYARVSVYRVSISMSLLDKYSPNASIFNPCPVSYSVGLASHWYVGPPFPRTLLAVSIVSGSHTCKRTSLQPSTQGRTPAQVNKPTVAPMKTKTTAWSLAESLWKHVVKTFSSFSPVQKLYPRQNWRLQSLHVFLEARGLSSAAAGFLAAVGASRATMVLLPKQVHLQKDVLAM